MSQPTTPEETVRLMDPERLRSLVVEWLKDDKTNSRSMKNDLKELEHEIVKAARIANGKELARIVSLSRDAREDACNTCYEMKGMESSQIFGDAQSEFLEPIEQLFSKGDKAEGPSLAFMALLKIADNALLELDCGDPRVQEGEEENDRFHERVDDLMLKICRHQAESNPSSLKGRKDKVKALRAMMTEDGRKEDNKDHEVLEYRYKHTLKFLQAFEKGTPLSKIKGPTLKVQAPKRQLASFHARKAAPSTGQFDNLDSSDYESTSVSESSSQPDDSEASSDDGEDDDANAEPQPKKRKLSR